MVFRVVLDLQEDICAQCTRPLANPLRREGTGLVVEVEQDGSHRDIYHAKCYEALERSRKQRVADSLLFDCGDSDFDAVAADMDVMHTVHRALADQREGVVVRLAPGYCPSMESTSDKPLEISGLTDPNEDVEMTCFVRSALTGAQFTILVDSSYAESREQCRAETKACIAALSKGVESTKNPHKDSGFELEFAFVPLHPERRPDGDGSTFTPRLLVVAISQQTAACCTDVGQRRKVMEGLEMWRMEQALPDGWREESLESSPVRWNVDFSQHASGKLAQNLLPWKGFSKHPYVLDLERTKLYEIVGAPAGMEEFSPFGDHSFHCRQSVARGWKGMTDMSYALTIATPKQ